MSEFKVHTILEQIIIEADHEADGSVKYHVCYGLVDWQKNGAVRPAVFVLMSYDGKINYRTPAHLTLSLDGESDFEKVLEALQYLKTKHEISKKYEQQFS